MPDFRYMSHDGYYDERFCPSCDETITILPGQERVQCQNEECGKWWLLCYDYSFDDGRWRDCTTVTEITETKEQRAL